MAELSKTVAIVTGASSGIGEAVARSLVAGGAEVRCVVLLPVSVKWRSNRRQSPAPLSMLSSSPTTSR